MQTCKIDVANETEDHNIPDHWTATFLNIRRVKVLCKEIMNTPERATVYSNTAQRLAQEAVAKKEKQTLPDWVKDFKDIFSGQKSHLLPTSKP